MKKELLKKYLANKCTGRDFDVLVGWVNTEAQNDEGKGWAYEHWKKLETDQNEKDEKKFQALLYKIHYEINLKKGKDSNNRRATKLLGLANWLSRAAAILFIPLLGVVFYMLTNNNFHVNKYTDMVVDSLEIVAPIGSRAVVQLADGTEVSLNYGSKMKYPRNFGKTREITLSGEGYFDVTHNPQKPFIVKTGNLNVKALGTKFNVCAYPEDNIIEATLIEGKVAVEKAIPGNKNQSLGIMLPGQHLSYDLTSGKISSTKGNSDKYIAWKDGKLVFDNEPVTEVAKTLGRMFNVDFEVADNVKDFTYTASFFNDPLDLILELMSETTPIECNILPRAKRADGTFSKQKIRIEKQR